MAMSAFNYVYSYEKYDKKTQSDFYPPETRAPVVDADGAICKTITETWVAQSSQAANALQKRNGKYLMYSKVSVMIQMVWTPKVYNNWAQHIVATQRSQ